MIRTTWRSSLSCRSNERQQLIDDRQKDTGTPDHRAACEIAIVDVHDPAGNQDLGRHLSGDERGAVDDQPPRLVAPRAAWPIAAVRRLIDDFRPKERAKLRGSTKPQRPSANCNGSWLTHPCRRTSKASFVIFPSQASVRDTTRGGDRRGGKRLTCSLTFVNAYSPKTPQKPSAGVKSARKSLICLARPTGIEPVFPP